MNIIISGFTGNRVEKVKELRDTLHILLTEAQLTMNKAERTHGVCIGRVSEKEFKVLKILGFKVKKI